MAWSAGNILNNSDCTSTVFELHAALVFYNLSGICFNSKNNGALVMNTKLFLLIGTSLSFIPTLAFAQCVATQDCATLGYTETSCNGGKGVKCPFGNFWACLPTKESICKEEGFTQACNGNGQTGSSDSCGGLYKKCSCNSSYKYTCSGTGYAGGSGSACGGKYTACKCSSGYTWNGSNCALSCDSSYKYTCSGTGYSSGSGTACGGKYTSCNCASGYEWNGSSCQKQVLNGAQGDLYYCNGKVVGIRATGMDFYIAMKDLGEMNWGGANSSCRSYSFCGSLKGRLPTKNQLLSIYNNKSQVNSLLSTNGGINMTEDFYWSDTFNFNADDYRYYVVHMSHGRGHWGDYDFGTYYVRPVLNSW